MKRLVKTKLVVILIALLAVQPALLNTAAAAPIVRSDSLFYYEIGGARAIHVAPNPILTNLVIGGNLELGLGYSCGKFDPVLGVSNMLNDVAAGVENMFDALVAAASAAISSLPMYILQRANPGLYDLMTTALLRAEEVISLATKSCEQMEAEIRQGKNPYEEWITISKGSDWKATMGTGGYASSENDVKEAQEEVESNNGSNGVPWVRGVDSPTGPKAGGTGQPPIDAVGDTAMAGYNITLNRDADLTTAPPVSDPAPRIVEIWPDPDAARAWLLNVVGGAIITTSEGGDRDAEPGFGLIPEVEIEKGLLATRLTNLVGNIDPPTPANLLLVSGPNTGVTRHLLEAIRRLAPAERGIVVDRLAEEIAMQIVFERAALMRRLLITGKKEPNIAAAQPAQIEIDEAIERLEKEIDTLVFESKAQREIISNTAQMVLRYDATKNRSGLGTPGVNRDAGQLLPGGGLQR